MAAFVFGLVEGEDKVLGLQEGAHRARGDFEHSHAAEVQKVEGNEQEKK